MATETANLDEAIAVLKRQIKTLEGQLASLEEARRVVLQIQTKPAAAQMAIPDSWHAAANNLFADGNPHETREVRDYVVSKGFEAPKRDTLAKWLRREVDAHRLNKTERGRYVKPLTFEMT